MTDKTLIQNCYIGIFSKTTFIYAENLQIQNDLLPRDSSYHEFYRPFHFCPQDEGILKEHS